MSKRSKYSEAEIAYIRENYKTMTVGELAAHLDRGEMALRQKMWQLKIRKHDCRAKAPEARSTLLDPDYEWVFCDGEWRARRKKPKPQPEIPDTRLLRFPRGWLLSNPGWRA